jgi:hypothetical protein
MTKPVKDLGRKFDVLRGFPDCASRLKVSGCWQDKAVAYRLGVRAGTWSKMKTGELKLDVGHGALLLEMCGIYHVSGAVFYKPMAEFKRTVEAVGLTGRNRFGALYPLWEMSKDHGLSIVRASTKTRGLTSSRGNEALTVRIGERVNIEVDYPPGGFITLFEIGPKLTELTVPSLVRTDVVLQKGRTVLPVEGRFFDVNGPAGSYWLLAAITENHPNFPTWARADEFNPDHPSHVLNEKNKTDLVELLQSCRQLETLALPYEIVGGYSSP